MKKDTWVERWNSNYKTSEFIYGKTPNQFFKQQIDKLSPSSILLPAEGEGRNAVYAAEKGWQVSAIDVSEEAKKKAEFLAQEKNVKIDYSVGDLTSIAYDKKKFDVIALIYAHFPPDIRAGYHKHLINLLKPNGLIIFEAFSKNHLEYRKKNEKVGGPSQIDFLFSIEEIKSDFDNFIIEKLEEVEVNLSEGLFHNGFGSVVRFVGRKI